jgi:hypothetical protein
MIERLCTVPESGQTYKAVELAREWLTGSPKGAVRKVGESKEDQVQRLPAAAENRGRNEGIGSAAMATTDLVVRRA